MRNDEVVEIDISLLQAVKELGHTGVGFVFGIGGLTTGGVKSSAMTLHNLKPTNLITKGIVFSRDHAWKTTFRKTEVVGFQAVEVSKDFFGNLFGDVEASVGASKEEEAKPSSKWKNTNAE
jgi:hypothetical protein